MWTEDTRCQSPLTVTLLARAYHGAYHHFLCTLCGFASCPVPTHVSPMALRTSCMMSAREKGPCNAWQISVAQLGLELSVSRSPWHRAPHACASSFERSGLRARPSAVVSIFIVALLGEE